MLMNGKLCKYLSVLLKGYLCIWFYSLHSTADVLEEVPSTAALCTTARLTGVSVHRGWFLAISSIQNLH